ncbi:YceI family protein [Nonomuraea helvata]|uniref:YceI family protein n=1 Tax=Nonomuraea helvata TaxID=37484 RepID=A0ABV5SJI0_9ACTN
MYTSHEAAHPSRQAEAGGPAGRRGLRALIRTKDGWPVRQAVVTVTDLTGQQVVRAEADADGVVSSGPLPGPTPETSAVAADIVAASIDTGNGMRDDHLRSPDFLNVDAYRMISYRSTGLTPAGTDRWTVHGTLTLAGVARPVDLDLAYLGTGPDPWGGLRAAFRAETELRREDFAMTYNQVVRAGVNLIGATLKVELDIQAVQGASLP